jgi:hypothetical protein
MAGKNKKLMNKVEKLLDEVYKNRKVAADIRFDKFKEDDFFRIHNGGRDYELMSEKKDK